MRWAAVRAVTRHTVVSLVLQVEVVHVCPAGVRPPAAMDPDTSLETTRPTGGTVTVHIHTTAASGHSKHHHADLCPAVCPAVHGPRRVASKSSTAKRTRTTRSQSSKGSVMEGCRCERVRPDWLVQRVEDALITEPDTERENTVFPAFTGN